jgi:hypothetical protein
MADELSLATPRELLQAIVQMAFEWGDLAPVRWEEFQVECQNQVVLPSWFKYLKRRKSKVWKSFSRKEQVNAAEAVQVFFRRGSGAGDGKKLRVWAIMSVMTGNRVEV